MERRRGRRATLIEKKQRKSRLVEKKIYGWTRLPERSKKKCWVREEEKIARKRRDA